MKDELVKDELVTFETAKLAKEKGFNWLCNNYNDKRDGDYFCNETTSLFYKNYNEIATAVSLPSQSLLQRWLREVYKIYCDPFHTFAPDGYLRFGYMLFNNSIQDMSHHNCYPTYEEALEEGLQESLKLIKN